jgi:hypothetical protein
MHLFKRIIIIQLRPDNVINIEIKTASLAHFVFSVTVRA